MAYLETHQLAVGYTHGKNTTTVLSDLNLELHRGHLTALLGQNGAGKSTLLRAITCTTRPLHGHITIGGADLATLSQRERSRIIGLVSTDRITLGGLTVNDLVALGRQPHTGFLGRLNANDRETVAEAIAAVGITHKANNYMSDLSDGERQKAMIARALAQATPIIVLDEPTAFLDVASRIETMQLLHSLAHDHDKAVLLSSHDVSQSLLMADDLWLITRDREVVAGPTQDIIASGAMQRIFTSDNVEFNPDILDYQYKPE
ncbi:MAG: ABC transporter ATP-binding protein [Muribaculaceae bacterium]|nr:ABC transporter ATP-binding protein [Muribaculaceae bacterium]